MGFVFAAVAVDNLFDDIDQSPLSSCHLIVGVEIVVESERVKLSENAVSILPPEESTTPGITW
jgi:hypothetical protein